MGSTISCVTADFINTAQAI